MVSTLKLELSGTVLCVRSVAMLPAGSLIVMLPELRALAGMLMPSSSFSPDVPVAWIVYWKTSEALPLPETVVPLPDA